MPHVGINAHLLSGQSGFRSAGIHGYLWHTLSHMADEAPPDWRFSVMCGRDSAADFAGLQLRRSQLDTRNPLRRILWEQLAQPFQSGAFDLLHAAAFVGPLLQTRPAVVTVYDLSFLRFPQLLSPWRQRYLRLLTRHSCHRASRVIAISQSTASDLADLLDVPRERIDIALPGVDVGRFRPLPQAAIDSFRQRKGLPQRFWLFIGTLEPRKNLLTLLGAYASLPARWPLIIAGGQGWDYAEIHATVERLGLNDEVHFPGYLPADELALWYNCAEVFVYPSLYEGFGMPVLEAMACGTPVIVADASSLPEVAGVDGTSLPPTDVDAWADALQHSLLSEIWREQERRRGLLR
ncbi:MAG: glycosyltransferase family 1 protein, partial [Anaerolineaceae bacterium]|nr:glycosyltransferase family 1 protein [Anaerolineaceae bacterium]